MHTLLSDIDSELALSRSICESYPVGPTSRKYDRRIVALVAAREIISRALTTERALASLEMELEGISLD